MTIKNLDTIEVLEAFLQGSQAVVFSVLGDKTVRYDFIPKMRVKIPDLAPSQVD